MSKESKLNDKFINIGSILIGPNFMNGNKNNRDNSLKN